MRRVLFISPHFPPDSTAGTHRARLLAPRLSEHGWEATVLTVAASESDGPIDEALADSVPAELRVVRVPAWPARLTRSLGIGDLGLRAFDGLWREASHLLSRERFDALFITVYPTYPALLGPLLKKRFKVPFVLDYQDPWVGAWGLNVGPGNGGRPDAKSRASRWLAMQLEPRVLGAADAVTAVSAATFDQAFDRYGIPRAKTVQELPIGWDERDSAYLCTRARKTASAIPRGDGRVHMVYVGTLLPTGLDTLRAFCTAWASWRARDAGAAERLRVHFFGTSNQRAGGAARVLPIARELGVGDLVTEHPDRLDYFDALRTLRDGHAVLLMGGHEPHYTPSKAYPAMVSGRPLVAVYHEASTATALLRRFGRAPSVHVVGFDQARPVATRVPAIADALADLVKRPHVDRGEIDRRVLDDVSAPVLAGRLANVFERVA